MVLYPHLFRNFPQFVVIHKMKEFSVVNEAEIVFCWLIGGVLFFFSLNSLAFSMIQQTLAI